MITEQKGDLLESGCDIICHQVNLHGIMGGGLAKQIAIQHPECKQEYMMYCEDEKYSKLVLGGSVLLVNTNNYVIANCFSQNEDVTTNYKWLKQCVKSIVIYAKEYCLTKVGIPKNYGCGIANGDWNIVKKIWCDAFKNEQNIELQIWEKIC